MKRLIVAALLFAAAPQAALAGAREAVDAYERGNYAVALKEFLRMAREGNAAAQNNLGVMYANGQGVKRDWKEAAKWYTMAAEAGMPLAQYNLGTLYEEGNGVEKDPATALIWYHLAANQGDVLAQYRMGVLYAEGRGTERHDVMAYYWLTLAAFHSGDVVLREDALALRKEVARRMNGKQIAAAEAMARDWRVSR